MTSTARTSPARGRLLLAGRVLVMVTIAAFATWSVIDNWAKVRQTWLDLAWESVAASLLAALAAMFANVLAWRASLADVEHRVNVPTAARISLIGGLAKYLPGSVWSYVLQMELGRRAGLPRPRAFLASVITTGLGLVTALLVGIVGLPVLLEQARDGEAQYAAATTAALWFLVILLPVALVCAMPPVLTRLIRLFLKIVRRPPLETPLTWLGVLRVMGWSALGWSMFGLHLWFLANAQAAPGLTGLLVCVGAFAIAMNAGMFAIVSPSGLGARESVLVAALVPFVTDNGGIGAALGIALASRLILTVADLLAAGLAAASGARLLRHSPASLPESESAPSAEPKSIPASTPEPAPGALFKSS